MDAVGRIVPVLPVPLIASVFVAQPQRALSELELKAEVGRLLARLEAAGAHVYIPRGDLDYALTVGLRMLHAAPPRARNTTACFARAKPSFRCSPTMPTPSRTFSDWTNG